MAFSALNMVMESLSGSLPSKVKKSWDVYRFGFLLPIEFEP